MHPLPRVNEISVEVDKDPRLNTLIRLRTEDTREWR